MRRHTLTALLILVVLVAATLVIALFNLDQTVSALAYTQGQGFTLGNSQPWRTLYAFGEYPALLLFGAALLTLMAGLVLPRFRAWRNPCLFLVLLYLIGPGLLVNVVFKDHWGRARPVETTLFGGNQPFTHPWQKRPSSDNKSFPSGHAAVAFYMIGPYFVLRQRKNTAARLWLIMGNGYGVAVSAARIVQGGHFFSDTLWSCGIVYMTATILAGLMQLNPTADATTKRAATAFSNTTER